MKINLFFLNRKIHYPPETTTIALLIRLLGMYIQSSNKNAILEPLKDFQSKVVNEDLMIAHKMLGPNFEIQLAELYPLFYKLFEGSATDLAEVRTFLTLVFAKKNLFMLLYICLVFNTASI